MFPVRWVASGTHYTGSNLVSGGGPFPFPGLEVDGTFTIYEHEMFNFCKCIWSIFDWKLISRKFSVCVIQKSLLVLKS